MSSPTLNLKLDHIAEYLNYFEKSIGSGKPMYDLQYLIHVKYFVKGIGV